MKNSLRKNMDVFALFLPETREFIKNKDFNGLKASLKNMNSMDIAEGWRHLEQTEKIIIFRLLGTKKAVEVFENLPFPEQNYILNNLENAEVSQILNEMAPDERADLFKEFPRKVSRKFFLLASKETVRETHALMDYPEGKAGSLMTTELVSLKKEMSAKQAILYIQENLRANYRENIYSLFVTDDSNRLIGSISLQDILKTPPDMLIRDSMTSAEAIKVSPEMEAQDLGNLFKKYDLFDAPVVDKDNKLIGIITVDDIVETLEKEATKDIYEIGKMDAKGGEIISYAKATAFELVKRRAGWLVLLLVFDFLTGTVLKFFEQSLSAVVALAFFIPMLLDTGGNAGAQTSITIIRGLATGDVKPKNVLKVIKLELGAALLMGLVVGIIAFGRAFLLQKDFMLSIVVGLTMLLIALLAIATGISLPLISKKVGLDPAVLAGPITTSVVDVVGLIIYFKIAQFFIPALRF
ncbi:MAG: magnesium transporter [Candidatus Omnitrophica bacterium]|nr:magnesium transporter [Candidatus Omnitrophota bacterium]